MKALNVWIGFDPAEAVAANVMAHSIQRRASRPVSIGFIGLRQIKRFYERKRGPFDSTEFSITRFLTPYLANYTNDPALFVDCDMIVRADIAELFDLFDPEYAVQVVKHDYAPRTRKKFLYQEQTQYARKNWSSVMLFNPARCVELTPEYVQKAPGLDLHQFKWLDGEHEIGALPKEWNHLVNEPNQCPADAAKLVHYTQGTPCFRAYAKGSLARWWHEERDAMLAHDDVADEATREAANAD